MDGRPMGLLEAIFRVAGETELADRTRPSVRQLGSGSEVVVER